MLMSVDLYADQVELRDLDDQIELRDNITLLPPRYDTLLFRSARISIADIFGEATTYYNPSVSTRSRGLDWGAADELFAPTLSARATLMVPTRSRLRVSATTSDYNFGVLAEGAATIFDGWDFGAAFDLRFGKSLFVDGVFSRNLRPELSLSKFYSLDHYLSFSVESPFLLRGLQSSSTAEAFELTNNKYYNSSWGLYNGEVRNSRVRRTIAPQFTMRYQRPLGQQTIFGLDVEGGYSRRSTSRLAWYDGYSPMPDYYRKMPSYFAQSSISQIVEQMWRDEDLQYTQIAWDDLVVMNQRSTTGSSYYVVEDAVSSVWSGSVSALFSSRVNPKLELTYGVLFDGDVDRRYKVLSDLLGGEYLLDIDPYIGDYTASSSNIQSDLQNPNREVSQGERFGYDYTMYSSSIKGALGAHYRGRNLEVNLNMSFGDQYIQREGHYENGRFEGALSYGYSKVVTLPDYNLDGRVTYTILGAHHIALRAQAMTLSTYADDLFIQSQYANRVIDDPVAQTLRSLSLRYSFSTDDFTLDVDGYFMLTRDGYQTWQLYDDLTYTYSDCVVTGIGTSSLGLDVVCSYSIARSLDLNLALAAGTYRYDVAPEVTLYDNLDMTEYSTSTSTAVDGCIVGNAPQIIVTSGLTYFINYGLILSLDCSYAGSRYVAPSFSRRTDRMMRGVNSPELLAEMVEQERLDDAYDLSLSLVKVYWLSRGRRVSLTLRANNILATSPIINYGREAGRVLRNSTGSTTGSSYLQPNSYTYGTSRTFYMSCNYYF